MGTSQHIAYSDAVLIPLFAALLSIVVRFIQLGEKKPPEELWALLAVGPDLMVAAVVAVPGLIAARNLGLHEAAPTLPSNSGTSPSATVVMAVLMFCCLVFGARYDCLWGKEARKKTGVRVPLLFGILPPLFLGTVTLVLALFVGTS